MEIILTEILQLSGAISEFLAIIFDPQEKKIPAIFILFIIGMIISFYSGYRVGSENCKEHSEIPNLKTSLNPSIPDELHEQAGICNF